MYDKILDVFNKLQESYSPSSAVDSTSRWIQESETEIMEDLDNMNYEMLFDLTTNVLQCIPLYLHDETDVNIFVNEFTEITSNITTYTATNGVLWNIDVMSKFLWIAMMIATTTSHKVIPHLAKLVNDNNKEYILKHEDNNGNNCFTLACWNIAALNELISSFSARYLSESTSKHITPFDLMSYTGGIVQLLENKVITFNDILSYENTYYKTNVVHMCALCVDNVAVLEYILESKTLKKEHMYSVDKNGNHPLLLSCIMGSIKSVELMLKSQLYGQEVISITNTGGQNILTYSVANNNILKYFIDLVDESLFFDMKIYNYINNDDIFQMFVKSKLFTYDILTREHYRTSTNVTCLVDWLFFVKLSFLDYVLNSSDQKVVDVMSVVFENKKNYLAMSFDSGIKMSIMIIKSKYINNSLLKEPHNGLTLLNKLINSISNDSTDSESGGSLDDAKDMITYIINSPHTTTEIITNEFINFCTKNFSNQVGKLIEKGFIVNIISLLYSMLNVNNVKAIIDLFNNNHINCLQLKGKIDLLEMLVKCDEKLLEIFLQNDSIGDDILSIFTTDNIINIQSKVKYVITDFIWSLLLMNKLLTTNKLNEFNNNGSILNNNISLSHLHLLEKIRPDFDQSLYFKKKSSGHSFFTSKLTNDSSIISYLISHPLFTIEEYKCITKDYMKDSRSNIFNKSNESIVELLTYHKYFDEDIMNIIFEGGNNLLQHLMLSGYDNKIIFHIVKHTKMNNMIFNHANNENENCLMTALYCGTYVSPIINSIHFKTDLMKIKNKNGMSAEDIIYDYMDFDFLIYYLKLFPKSDLLYRPFNNGNTIVHKIISNNTNEFNSILIELLSFYDFDVLCVENNDGNTPLHYMTDTDKLYEELELLLEMKKSTVKKIYFYKTNNFGRVPMANIISNTRANNIGILTKLIDMNIFDKTDMSTIVSRVKSNLNTTLDMSVCEYIINENVALLDILDKYNFDISKELEKMSLLGEPLFFLLIRTCIPLTEKYYSKYVGTETLNLKNSNNETLLFEVMNIDHKLCNALIDAKIINVEMVLPYIEKLLSKYPSTIKFLLTALPELFSKDNLIHCISQCIDNNQDVLEMLMGSKYYTVDVFTEIYNKPELINSLFNSSISLKYMFENNLVTAETLKKDNCKLMFEICDPIYLRKMCDIIFDTDEKFYEIKTNGKTIFHKCAGYQNLVNIYIKRYTQYSKNNEYKILLERDNNGKTFLDYLIENEYYNDITNFFEIHNDNLLSKLIKNQDIIGRNIVMKSCLSEKLQPFLNKIKKYITNDVIFQYDCNKTTTLMYILRYTSAYQDILVQKIEDKNLLWQDAFNNDIFTIASRYNSQNLNILLTHKNLVDTYNNFNECFVIACRYESRSINLLLSTGKINLKKCYGFIQYDDALSYANFLQVACRYNEDSVRELLHSNINLQEFIDNVQNFQVDKDKMISFNALKIALLYEPNAVTLLLDSKYGSTKMIADTNVLCKDGNCLIEIIEKQMASYSRLTKSKHFKKSNYDHPIYGNISTKYADVLSYDNVFDKLLKYKDIPCNENHKNVCSTCYSNENRVVFSPCWHKSCIMCSTRLYQCPQCRAKISDRIIYN